MPKEVTEEFCMEFLQKLSMRNHTAARCNYVCQFLERFFICCEKSGKNWIYYAVDLLTGRMSLALVSDTELSPDTLLTRKLQKLNNAVKYTGVFNAPLIYADPRMRA